MPRFNRQVEALIANFRDIPEDPGNLSGAGAKPLSSLLETCIERYHIGKHTPEETIQENWHRIAGSAFAKRCRPERIDRSGALVVQVPNATVRRELIFHEERILAVLSSLPGCQHIRSVVLKSG